VLTLLNVATRFVSPVTAPEVLVDISYAQVDNSTSAQNIIIAFHPGAFQGIIFIHREAMVKDSDS
jgi:hypothetical protein